MGFPAAAGSGASRLWAVITATRSPGSLSSFFLKGFLMLGSEGMPAEQAVRLATSNAARHTRHNRQSLPRVRTGPNFEPPSFRRYFAVVLNACGAPTMSASIISARSRKF